MDSPLLRVDQIFFTCLFFGGALLFSAQAMVEVEIREIPRPFPTMLPTGVTGIAGRGQGANANETVQDAKVAAAAADSWSLSPEALFRAYLERERKGGRNISDEVRCSVACFIAVGRS